MSLVIELNPELETRLRRRTEQMGEPPEQLVRRLLDTALGEFFPTPPKALRVVDENGVFHQDRWDDMMASIRLHNRRDFSPPDEAYTREAIDAAHD